MKNVLVLIGDILFPKTCLSCGRLGSYICITCAKSLPVITRDICPYCTKASYLGLTHPACKRTFGVDGLISFFYYNNQTQKIIKAIKYRLVKRAVRDFLQLVPHDRIQLIHRYKDSSITGVEVPLYPSRARARGFNQAELIANFLCSTVQVPHSIGLVRRVKNTDSQARITSHKIRYENMRGAFRLSGDASVSIGSTYIIFDDVWTSGATIKELARIFKRGGATKVYAVTLAR